MIIKDIFIGLVVIIAVFIVVKIIDILKEIGGLLELSDERQEGEN